MPSFTVSHALRSIIIYLIIIMFYGTINQIFIIILLIIIRNVHLPMQIYSFNRGFGIDFPDGLVTGL